jgi:hypothetical protein
MGDIARTNAEGGTRPARNASRRDTGGSCTPSAFSRFSCSCHFEPAPKVFRGSGPASLFDALLTNHFVAAMRHSVLLFKNALWHFFSIWW